ncbi:MAG: hypothetical protein LBC33_03280 [Mycoplasmataceae bacterium]|jgi:hypothetical protein|nr:hypothetical protein [Mycoplasmataceae bacterium]
MIEFINPQKHGNIIIDENTIKAVISNLLKHFAIIQLEKIAISLNNTDYLIEIILRDDPQFPFNKINDIQTELRRMIETNLEIYNFIICFSVKI